VTLPRISFFNNIDSNTAKLNYASFIDANYVIKVLLYTDFVKFYRSFSVSNYETDVYKKKHHTRHSLMSLFNLFRRYTNFNFSTLQV
jgi:hypothetical protein